jgi:hypothetical protein
MDTLFKKFKEIDGIDLPFNISARVMRQIFLQKIKYLLIVGSVLFLTLATLLNRVYRILIETEAMSVVKVIINDFELSWSYFNDSAISMFEVLPINEIKLLVLNVGLIGILGIYAYRMYQSEKKLFINS